MEVKIEIVENKEKYYDDLYKIHKNTLLEQDQMSKKCFYEEFTLPTRKYFVAKKGDLILGYIGVLKTIDDYNIMGIAVEENFQHKKIGTKLLQTLIKDAKLNNIATISLEVDEKNEKAINFYKKNGFKLTNIRKNYYKDNDAYIMWYYL